MTTVRRRFAVETMGLELVVEPLRWSVRPTTRCPDDVRAALAGGEPLEGTARGEHDAERQAFQALGYLRGWLAARRQPVQEHMFAAHHFERQRDEDWRQLRTAVEAAVLAFERGWTWTAAALILAAQRTSASLYALSTGRRAHELADQAAADLRRRGLAP